MIDHLTRIVNWSVAGAFALCFGYQAVYFFNRYSGRGKRNFRNRKAKKHGYAVLIAARNEENVITELLGSIRRQSYPSERLDVYVVADNCTDRTAEAAAENGAAVYTRTDPEKRGKGYALQYLIGCMMRDGMFGRYDGFFVFDADNILAADYVERMNEAFDAGYSVVTSMRNSKNFGQNWLSFGYGLWFLHDSQFLNKGRLCAGNSCMVSGTGYLIRREVIEKNGGWKHFLLTEDVEFTADCILHDVPIGYCEAAMFYDEQPVRLRDSWRQRVRWVKGYYQVSLKYGKALIGKCIRERSASCFDMLMVNMPAFVLTAFAAAAGIALLLAGLLAGQDISFVIYSAGQFLVKTYGALLALGFYTVLSQWKRIAVSPGRKLLLTFAFPLFMYTYFPIAIAAFRKRVEWTPVAHTPESQCHPDGAGRRMPLRTALRGRAI